MIDRLLTGLLAITVLAGASVAMTTEFISTQSRSSNDSQVVQLPRVVVTGRVQPASTDLAKAELPRAPAAEQVTRPQ
jgi:hypothetical protein